MYVPSETQQMTTPFKLLKATSSRVNGVLVKSFSEFGGAELCNFKTYGGTETTQNGVIVVEDTAQITCSYNPNIEAADGIRILLNNHDYEIIGEPEDIELRHRWMRFKVKRVKGGA